MPQNERMPESGNAFIIILVAVALFVSLAFVITRGLQSQTTTALSGREIKLAATDIMAFSQRMERAVDRVRQRGCSENEISFDSNFEAGYDHASAPPDKCQVFSKDGGGGAWQNPPKGANDGTLYVITGSNKITNLGEATDNDLVLILPNLDLALCNEINTQLGISLATMPPVDGASSDISTKYKGSFSGADEIGVTGGGTAGFESLPSACFQRGAAYHFYHTLLVR